MAKYTIEYKRTVRVREYETLTLGYSEEFDAKTDYRTDAYEYVSNCVDGWIKEKATELRKEK